MPTPRILCLHGGGTNADVFRAQCRGLLARLSPPPPTTSTMHADSTHHAPLFRLVFVDAPFLSAPHPAIVNVYGDHGPFRRWLRWLPEQQAVDGDSAVSETLHAIRRAMDDDDDMLRRSGEDGVTAHDDGIGGEWVGILGFSQGAKVAISLLWAQERVERAAQLAGGGKIPATDDTRHLPLAARFKFGVLMAGRAPVVGFIPGAAAVRGVADAGQLSSDFDNWPSAHDTEHRLQSIPTLHVHGLQDHGLECHRALMRDYCAHSTATLVEWDGDHRLPLKSADVEAVTTKLLQVARQAGVSV